MPDTAPIPFQPPGYEIVRELGRGGMGVVYLARNTLMNRLEVLKVLGADLLAESGAADRFLREIQSAARLAHPNVVTAYAALQVGPQLAFAMEYVEGEDLARIVKEHGPFPIHVAAICARQAAAGLQHAHARGMVHRDIKPANLILTKAEGRYLIKVLDFGLAKLNSDPHERTKRDSPTQKAFDLTAPGQVMGTPHFMAPEQTLDTLVTDIRGDIYSLGCTLFYLLTGRVPFPNKSLDAIFRAHRESPPPAVESLRPDVPPALSAVIRRMMAKVPADRYATPGDVAAALAPFTTPIKTTTPPEPTAPPLPVSAVAPPKVAPPPPVMASVPPRLAATAPTVTKTAEPPSFFNQIEDNSLPMSRVARKRGNNSLVITWTVFAAVATLVLGVTGYVISELNRFRSGTIVVENLPADGEVTIDGLNPTPQTKGVFDHSFVGITPGPHTVKVSRRGNVIHTQEVVISRSDPTARVKVDSVPIIRPPTPSPKKTSTATPTPDQSPAIPEEPVVRLSPKFVLSDRIMLREFVRQDADPTKVDHGEWNEHYYVRLNQPYGLGTWNLADLPVNFALEMIGRVRGVPSTRWGVNLTTNAGISTPAHGIQVMIDGKGALYVAKGSYEKGPDSILPKTGFSLPRHLSTLKTGEEYNRVMIIVRNRMLEVYVNGTEAIPPLALTEVVSPAIMGFTGISTTSSSLSFAELKRFEVWNVDRLPPVEKRSTQPVDSIASGFTSLFPNNNLSMWSLGPQQVGPWLISDGVVKGAAPKRSHLYTVRENYADCQVQADVRFTSETGNGGIIVRSQGFPNEFDSPIGYELDLGLSKEGLSARIIPNLANKTATTLKDLTPFSVVPMRVNAWARVELTVMETALGTRITAYVNGVCTHSLLDEKPSRKSGHIALQQWMPGIEYRNVAVRSLE